MTAIHYATRVPSDAHWSSTQLTFTTQQGHRGACGQRPHWNWQLLLLTSRVDVVTCARCKQTINKWGESMLTDKKEN